MLATSSFSQRLLDNCRLPHAFPSGFGDYLHVVATEWMLWLAMAAFVAKSPWPVALRTGVGSTDVYPLCGAVQFATHPVALGTLCSCWALCVVLICILRLQPAFCQHVVVLADFLPAYAGERHADVIGDAVMNCSTNEACTRPGPSFLAVSHEWGKLLCGCRLFRRVGFAGVRVPPIRALQVPP